MENINTQIIAGNVYKNILYQMLITSNENIAMFTAKASYDYNLI
jgi:hypothetical protein